MCIRDRAKWLLVTGIGTETRLKTILLKSCLLYTSSFCRSKHFDCSCGSHLQWSTVLLFWWLNDDTVQTVALIIDWMWADIWLAWLIRLLAFVNSGVRCYIPVSYTHLMFYSHCSLILWIWILCFWQSFSCQVWWIFNIHWQPCSFIIIVSHTS